MCEKPRARAAFRSIPNCIKTDIKSARARRGRKRVLWGRNADVTIFQEKVADFGGEGRRAIGRSGAGLKAA